MIATLPWMLALALPLVTVETSGYALVITNNRSLVAERPDLHYADDDGARYAELFAELLGVDRVQLLTRLDEASAAILGSTLRPVRLSPPTRAALAESVEVLRRQLAEDRARGRQTSVTLVFAGHGDLDQGVGFVELEDGRFTAHELEHEVLAKLDADRIHVLLDSCNSFFMLNPRKPGGRRWRTQPELSAGVLGGRQHVGAIVSTSAEALTYEWSELQSGIFSYVVRSGLRGAADADGDRRVTYAELASFIEVAVRRIPNDLYRPKVFAQAPRRDGEEVLLDLRQAGARSLKIGGSEAERVTVRTPLGVRVLDVHTEPGADASVVLPVTGELYTTQLVYAKETARPAQVTRAIPELGEPLKLSELPAAHDRVGTRSGMPVFQRLFDDPFGPKAFADVRARVLSSDPSTLPLGVTRLDAARLSAHLNFAGAESRSQRLLLGMSFVGLGTSFLAARFLDPSIAGNASIDLRGVDGALLGAGGGLVAAGLLSMVIPHPQEGLSAEFGRMDLSTEPQRARAVVEIEGRFQRLAEETMAGRRLGGFVAAGAGVLSGGLSVFAIARQHPGQPAPPLITAGLHALVVAQGLYLALLYEYPIERAWRFYVQDSKLGDHPSSGPPPIEPVASVGAGSGMLGLRGSW